MLCFVYITFLMIWVNVTAAPWDPRQHITFYEHESHQGQSYHEAVGRKCYNLPSVFDNRASSIDTHHGCVKVCTEVGCKGCFRMEPGTKGHHSLAEVNLNDNISSFTHCGN